MRGLVVCSFIGEVEITDATAIVSMCLGTLGEDEGYSCATARGISDLNTATARIHDFAGYRKAKSGPTALPVRSPESIKYGLADSNGYPRSVIANSDLRSWANHDFNL